MKKLLTAIFILLLTGSMASFGLSGKVFDNLILPSKILKSERKYAI